MLVMVGNKSLTINSNMQIIKKNVNRLENIKYYFLHLEENISKIRRQTEKKLY